MQIRHPRFVGFVAVFALAGGTAALWLSPDSAVVVGFDLAAIAFILFLITIVFTVRFRAAHARHDLRRLLAAQLPRRQRLDARHRDRPARHGPRRTRRSRP